MIIMDQKCVLQNRLLQIEASSFTVVVDMAWGGWIKGRKSGFEMGIPYIRVEAANHPFVRAVDNYLQYRFVFLLYLYFENKYVLLPA